MNNSRMAPPSGIPRLGSPGKLGLATITDSQSNARSNQSMLPPPPSLKHKLGPTCELQCLREVGKRRLTDLLDNEPEPKRKTLVERAGEPRSIATATHGPRAVVKGTSLLGAGVRLKISLLHLNAQRYQRWINTPTTSSRNLPIHHQYIPGVSSRYRA